MRETGEKIGRNWEAKGEIKWKELGRNLWNKQ